MPKKIPSSVPEKVNTYGLPVPSWAKEQPESDAFKIKLQFYFDKIAFSTRRTWPDMPTRPEIFKRMADTIVPGWFEWHSWTNKIIEALCKYRWCSIMGCSNSSKSYNVASFAALWWLADPDNSSVFFCSTTSKMLKKRGWAEIQKFNQAIGGFGNFVNSQTVWQSKQGDDRHAIFGKAVADGDMAKAAADIQGVHTKRQMLVLDEAEAIPPAIWTAAKNLYSYPDDVGGEFLMVAMANPRSRLSQFGRYTEPEGGYDSVSVDTDEWIGKPQIDGKKTFVIRFDFLKSPNLIEGKEVSKHLPKAARIKAQMTTLKLTGGENNPDFWCYSRGFPPPEGLNNTVFTESLLTMHDAYGKHQFTGSKFKIIGALDPAYGGGDRPALRFAALGEIGGNKMGIEWMYPIILSIDVTSKDPVRYQLVNQCKKHCANVEYRGQRYVCAPENFGIDTTGDAGTADIAQREWSPNIIRICFSESPSEDPCSAEDERPAKDVYLNKRVEMYYRTRSALMSGQLRGVDRDTASELCTLEELVSKKDGTVFRKTSIQSKKEYKLKFQKSPDFADCGVEITEVARIKGFTIAAIGLTAIKEGEINVIVKLANAVYEDIDYSRDNLELEEA